MAITEMLSTWERVSADLEDHRVELINDEIVVVNSPLLGHQVLVIRLANHLISTFDGFEVVPDFTASHIFRGNEQRVRPDVMVVPRETSWSESSIELAAAVVVVEILSDSTRHRDWGIKRDLYADADVPEYWIIDPATESVTIHVLEGDSYAEAPAEQAAAAVSALFNP